jgi:hypothetical protein
MRHLPLALLVSVAACRGPAAPTGPHPAVDTGPALVALRAARFPEARDAAAAALKVDPRSSTAAAVHAIATYQEAGDALITSLTKVLEHADHLKFFDHEDGRAAWRGFLARLEEVDRDLAVVAADPGFALELCPACWEHDWNHNGRIDERDRLVFEIELDGKLDRLPEGDPRRRPTFRFDVGDAEWARAMIDFQRAAVELVLAYRWSELDKFFAWRGDEQRMVLHLIDAGRARHARELLLAALDAADRCRLAYLAETDDDREWVPSPRQRSHPMPLDVDADLYATWAGVTGDVRRLLASEEALPLAPLARVLAGATPLDQLPAAQLDLGQLLRDPTDVVLDLGKLGASPAAIDAVLHDLLGHGYVTGKKASPLPGRLHRMREDLDHGQDTFERKLRYLFWLN